jgi:hypothetical protein
MEMRVNSAMQRLLTHFMATAKCPIGVSVLGLPPPLALSLLLGCKLLEGRKYK